MERVATLLGLSLLLFLQLPGTQATGRRLFHPDPLPPCSQKPGGVAGWDCYDTPNHPLRPCDFHHQRVGVDCSGWRPVSHADDAAAAPTVTTFKSKTRPLLERHIAIDLPPCSQSSGADGTPDSWKCFNAPRRPLPPALDDDVGEASAATVESEASQEKGGHVEAELPPCSEVPGGIAGWDCYDTPNHPLPPCDFHHQRIGFDCWGWPPVSHVGGASSTTTSKSETTTTLPEGHVAIDLPPCSQSSGDSTDSWKCFHAPARPLPPAVGSDVGEASAATVESEASQEKGGHVEAELPPCSEVPGGIAGWDCYDLPNHPLPPCDFHHQRIGFDCSGWPPVGHAGGASPTTTFKSETTTTLPERHVAIDLPPCSQSSGDSTDSWKCLHLPPCNTINGIIGVNCSGWPPAVGSDVGEASPATVESETTQEKGGRP